MGAVTSTEVAFNLLIKQESENKSFRLHSYKNNFFSFSCIDAHPSSGFNSGYVYVSCFPERKRDGYAIIYLNMTKHSFPMGFNKTVSKTIIITKGDTYLKSLVKELELVCQLSKIEQK